MLTRIIPNTDSFYAVMSLTVKEIHVKKESKANENCARFFLIRYPFSFLLSLEKKWSAGLKKFFLVRNEFSKVQFFPVSSRLTANSFTENWLNQNQCVFIWFIVLVFQKYIMPDFALTKCHSVQKVWFPFDSINNPLIWRPHFYLFLQSYFWLHFLTKWAQ